MRIQYAWYIASSATFSLLIYLLPIIQNEKVIKYMTKFKRAVSEPYTLITPLSALADLEEFLKTNIFALGSLKLPVHINLAFQPVWPLPSHRQRPKICFGSCYVPGSGELCIAPRVLIGHLMYVGLHVCGRREQHLRGVYSIEFKFVLFLVS